MARADAHALQSGQALPMTAAPTVSALRAELLPVADVPSLADDWGTLEARGAASLFNCWRWVSTWLAQLPATYQPLVFRAHDHDGLLALGLLVRVPERGGGRLVAACSLSLQETGDAAIDEITIEYGGLLARPGAEVAAYGALFQAVGGVRGWRRLRISATAHAPAIAAALPAGWDAACVDIRPSYHVDLRALRDGDRGYLDSLPAKVRGSLNQTRRGYGAHGELRAEVAADVPTALAWFETMADLHSRYWNGKGLPGAFASPFFNDFHRALVAAGVDDGYVRMTRVSAGPVLVGYLYNLAWEGRVHYYNSGLNYGALGRHDRPGMAALYAVLEQTLAEGWDDFDFLAGEQDYKRRLASGARTLYWIDVRCGGARLAGERLLGRLAGRQTFGTPLAAAIATGPVRPSD